MLNRNVTNEALMADENARTILESGQIVIVDKTPTKHPDYISMYLAGYVTVTNSGQSSVSGAKRILLGWGETTNYIARTVVNAHKDIAEKLTIGSALEFKLRIIDTDEPQWDSQEPREDRDGNQLVNAQGFPVYRSYDLVTVEEFEALGHEIIEAHKQRDTAPKVSASDLVKANVTF